VFIESLEPRALLAAPIIITRGGVYTGTWESKDPDVPAVTIHTSQPVTIVNSVLRGPGNLIANDVDHTNVTVRHSTGYGTNPNILGEAKGQFVNLDRFDNAVIESNRLEGTGGILLLDYLGNHTLKNSIRVSGNAVHNIDGRRSNGKGGYLDYNILRRLKDRKVLYGYEDTSFVQLNKVRAVPGIDISWNSVINDVGVSRVEDDISIYKSSGTLTSPIRIHHNYIQGGYTIRPWQKSWKDSTYIHDWSYSGGGINLGDGTGDNAADDPAYVKAYYNTIVSTTNFGIALSAGHNLEAYGNRIIQCGMTTKSRYIAAANVGIYVWDSYEVGYHRFYNNVAHDNLVGWMRGTDRNDWWVPDAKSFKNNVHWSGTITATTERQEWTRWASAAGRI
jgi:hypothetical protein